MYHVGAREYDPRTARWLQRDPIDAASGDPNLYRYAGNDPINAFDDGMRGDTKRQVNSGRKSSFIAHRKIAFIAVGDIKDKWWSQWAVNWGVRRDVALLRRKFSAAGYEVRVDWRCNKQEMLSALRSREVHAFAFVGHNAFEGALAPYGGKEGEESSFVDASDISQALGNRRLDWAIIHACYTDTSELRRALVGDGGHWEAAKGLWNPVIGVDLGDFGWWKGKWQRKQQSR
ncbi:MAG: hypothetical protein KatS3mg022_2033 [Armatimonadota bacterium]|nr:MAG: hypothetical protein KatS3mg022_2033 [Armatimonadota bacterium]